MKQKKILNRLTAFFDLKARKKRKHRKELGQLLKQLSDKERKLKKKIEKEKKGTKQAKLLTSQLDIVRAQRKKGFATLKDLKE